MSLFHVWLGLNHGITYPGNVVLFYPTLRVDNNLDNLFPTKRTLKSYIYFSIVSAPLFQISIATSLAIL
uniref:Putative ovule protein n=1 Tax=Solanum chacoense TaxID=4108 RepID=A0A0V0GWE4_SOLCH